MKAICESYFGDVLNAYSGLLSGYRYYPLSVQDLIYENLKEKEGRHLMVIGKSDSIVNLITYYLRSLGMDPMVLCGSQFPDDADGDYSYGILSRIMVRNQVA